MEKNVPENQKHNIVEFSDETHAPVNQQNIVPYFQMRTANNAILSGSRNEDLHQTQPQSTYQSAANYLEEKFNVSQIFSGPFGLITWFFGLKWYVIIFIVVFGLFLFFQVESAIEIRKSALKTNKEGMKTETVERMKGILRETDIEIKKDIPKKNVSFSEETTADITNTSSQSKEPMTSQINETDNLLQSQQIYNLWIRPWIYTIFRNFNSTTLSRSSLTP